MMMLVASLWASFIFLSRAQHSPDKDGCCSIQYPTQETEIGAAYSMVKGYGDAWNGCDTELKAEELFNRPLVKLGTSSDVKLTMIMYDKDYPEGEGSFDNTNYRMWVVDKLLPSIAGTGFNELSPYEHPTLPPSGKCHRYMVEWWASSSENGKEIVNPINWELSVAGNSTFPEDKARANWDVQSYVAGFGSPIIPYAQTCFKVCNKLEGLSSGATSLESGY